MTTCLACRHGAVPHVAVCRYGLFLGRRVHPFPYQGGQCRADQWPYDEYPQVGESRAALEQCRADAACRVHRRAGVAYADKVY